MANGKENKPNGHLEAQNQKQSTGDGKDDEDSDSAIDLEEIMADLQEPLNLKTDQEVKLNDQYFKF